MKYPHKYKFIINCKSSLQADAIIHELSFFSRKPEYASIDREDNTITIEISEYFCVICNLLKKVQKKGLLTADNNSLNWLKEY